MNDFWVFNHRDGGVVVKGLFKTNLWTWYLWTSVNLKKKQQHGSKVSYVKIF